MTRSRGALAQLLDDLRRDLRPLGRRQRRRVLAEIEDHVLSAIEAGEDENDAIRRLGHTRGALAGFPVRRRAHRAVLFAVPAVLLALAAPVSGPLVQRVGAGQTPSQAATISPARQERLAREACVRSWNGPGGARWRTLLRRSHARQAFVAIGYRTRARGATAAAPVVPGAGAPPVVASCGVRIMLARVASPYQRGVVVVADKVDGAFRFSRSFQVRTRTAAPGENATSDSSGRLTLAEGALAPVCPHQKLGSRVLSVVAGPRRTVLVPHTTTELPRGTRSFVVAIRNTGTVTIDGVVASLELYAIDAPDRATWRSKPVTIARLHAGGLVEVPFVTPALGTATRLVRATTAAIACETSLGDNSPVFPVSPT